MTQPATVRLELPPVGYPTVVRVISLPPLSAGLPDDVIWKLNEENPLASGARIVRMFDSVEGGVEVYSVDFAKGITLRNRIPAMLIKFVEEYMPPDVFVQELKDAESEGDSDDDDDGDDESSSGSDSGLELDNSSAPLGASTGSS